MIAGTMLADPPLLPPLAPDAQILPIANPWSASWLRGSTNPVTALDYLNGVSKSDAVTNGADAVLNSLIVVGSLQALTLDGNGAAITHLTGANVDGVVNTATTASAVPAAGVQSGNLPSTVTNTGPLAASQLTGTISTNRLPTDQIEFVGTNNLASGAHTTVGNAAIGNTNTMTVAVALSANNLATTNFNAQLAAAGTVTTNMAQTLYADTNALTFLNANGVTDIKARERMIIAVNDAKTMGVWSNIVDMGSFEPQYNPANGLTMMGRTMTYLNPVWSKDGFGPVHYTNQISLSLPPLTNYSIAVFFRQDAAGIDAYDHTADARNYLAGLKSTNDNSALAMTAFSNYRGGRVWTSTGTNWLFAQNNDVASNSICQMMSGGIRSDGAMAPITPTMWCASYSNGLVKVFINGNDAFQNQAVSATNAMWYNTNSLPVNLMLLGGGDTNWNRGGTLTNAYGITFMGFTVFNQPMTTNMAAAALRIFTDSDYRTESLELIGSSIINDQKYAGSSADSGGTSPGVALTNSLGYIDELQNPKRFVFNSACPGSSLLYYTNILNTAANQIAFTPVSSCLNQSLFQPVIKADSGRNDKFIGTSDALTMGYWNYWSTHYVPANAKMEWIWTPWAYDTSIANNNAWVAFCFAMKTNSNITTFWPFGATVSSNRLASVSEDSPPVHPNAINSSAHSFMEDFDNFINGKPSVSGDVTPTLTVAPAVVNDAGITNTSQLKFNVTGPNGEQRLLANPGLFQTIIYQPAASFTVTNTTLVTSFSTNLVAGLYIISGKVHTSSTSSTGSRINVVCASTPTAMMGDMTTMDDNAPSGVNGATTIPTSYNGTTITGGFVGANQNGRVSFNNVILQLSTTNTLLVQFADSSTGVTTIKSPNTLLRIERIQ